MANNAGTQAGEVELAALHKSAAAAKELVDVMAPKLSLFFSSGCCELHQERPPKPSFLSKRE